MTSDVKHADGRKITFLGDLYLPQAFASDFVPENYIPNLEFAITDETSGVPGKVNLKASDCYMEATFGAAPLAVCLANNHVFDFGETGFVDTIDVLSARGIPYFGAGSISEQYSNPFLVEINGVRVAILAYVCKSTNPAVTRNIGHGVAIIDIGLIGSDIDNAKAFGAERIVVVFHWGSEHVHKAKYDDVVIARKTVDLGVDLVVGHHAHCIQNHEVYNGVHIFYGLGNCLFPDFSAPAYYDESSCTPTRTFSYKQKYWNRKSLAVEYDPSSNTVDSYKLNFDNRRLKKGSRVSLCADSIVLGTAYHRAFKRAYYYGKLRGVFFNWLENPRLPTIKHFQGIMKVLGDKRYK